VAGWLTLAKKRAVIDGKADSLPKCPGIEGRGVMRLLTVATAAFVATGLNACDQLPGGSRYEVVVDKNGRTIRLDKRSGEITIIDGDRLVSPKSAAEADKAQKLEGSLLAKAKDFRRKTIKHMSIEVDLQTSWQDGNVYYNLDFRPLQSEGAAQKSGFVPDLTGKKGDSVSRKPANLQRFKEEMARHEFSLLLEDVPFELLRQKLSLTYHADDKGEVMGYGATGRAPMSQEMYKRIDSWNINWQTRFR
jgi:hypothetical protein